MFDKYTPQSTFQSPFVLMLVNCSMCCREQVRSDGVAELGAESVLSVRVVLVHGGSQVVVDLVLDALERAEAGAVREEGVQFCFA